MSCLAWSLNHNGRFAYSALWRKSLKQCILPSGFFLSSPRQGDVCFFGRILESWGSHIPWEHASVRCCSDPLWEYGPEFSQDFSVSLSHVSDSDVCFNKQQCAWINSFMLKYFAILKNHLFILQRQDINIANINYLVVLCEVIMFIICCFSSILPQMECLEQVKSRFTTTLHNC